VPSHTHIGCAEGRHTGAGTTGTEEASWSEEPRTVALETAESVGIVADGAVGDRWALPPGHRRLDFDVLAIEQMVLSLRRGCGTIINEWPYAGTRDHWDKARGERVSELVAEG